MNTWQNQLADARTGLRRAIHGSALQLIAERGMPNVTMSAVARAAGVSRQTLYNHYANLEAIVVDAAETEIGLANEALASLARSAPNASTALDLYVRRTLSAATGSETNMTGAGMSPEAEAKVIAILEPVHQHLVGILRRGVDEREFRDDLDPESVSEVLFHMIGSGRGLIHMGREPDHVISTIADLIQRSVAR
jgi:TetR/AcrR family transcriptional regulator, mexCD-oprJ operon repressor